MTLTEINEYFKSWYQVPVQSSPEATFKSSRMNVHSEKEKLALLKFRECLTDLDLETDRNADCFLIKWLRARDLNISKAEAMLRKSLKYRIDNHIDEVLNWKPPDPAFAQLFPMEICGYDQSGCPIVIVPSTFDMDTFRQLRKEDCIKYMTQNTERIIQAMKVKSTRENPITEFVSIHDFEGFNISSIMNMQFYNFISELVKSNLDNYPELIHKTYFCFCPKTISLLFSLVKHAIPKKTMEKVKVYGHDKDQWLPSMLEHIDMDQIPPKFGGTNHEYEKNSMYEQYRNRKLEDKTESEASLQFEVVRIPPGGKHKVQYNIEVPETKISWIFKTEQHDISFSVVYELTDEELVAKSRVDAAKTLQMGEVTCEKAGTYSLVFNNSYSRFTGKSLHLCVTLDPDPIVIDMEKDDNYASSQMIVT